MKQTIKILTALLVLLVTGSTGAWAQTFSGGSGTSTDPYQIKTIADMTALATAVNGGTDYSNEYFLLMSDITYSSTDAYTVIGGEGHAFAGNFNGNGNTIKGIRYNYTEDSSADIGLFGYVINGKVENLTLDDCWFQKTGTSNGDIAVVVGYANYTEIDKVIVKNCKAIAKNGNAAGITAYAYSPVTNCVVENTEISVFDGTTLYGLAGGIVAYENGSSASNNVVLQCTIQAHHVGGVCGDAATGGPVDNNHVENCTITGKESAGGISTVAGNYGSYAHGFSHAGNTVAGTTIVQADDAAGALFAQKGYNGWTDNYYAKEVKVIIGSTTYDGSTARGYYDGSAPANADGVGEGTFYKATVVANPAAGGTVRINRQWCLAGKSMTSTVTATPNAGFNFIGWTSTDVTLADATASSTTFTKALTSAVTITANFGAGLFLDGTKLKNATVTFYNCGTTEPTTFDVSAPGTAVAEADAGDWIVVHIEPNDGFWTDEKLLMSMEAGTLPTARKRAIDLDPGRKLTLLKVDNVDPADANSALRHDGAGWYYYQIPAAHTVAAGYTRSVIDGYVVPKFDLTTVIASQSVDLKTVTLNQGNGWTATISLDETKLIFDFDGAEHVPVITGIAVSRNGNELISLSTGIENQLSVDGALQIGEIPLCLNPADKCWFQYAMPSSTGLKFLIDVPFTVADKTKEKGASDNPWLITNAADLNLLAKCVNVGEYSFSGKFLKMKENGNFDMSAITDFISIGYMTPFLGTFDGNGQTISGLKASLSIPDLDTPFVSDGSDIGYGLFGKAGGKEGVAIVDATIKNVTLNGCSFSLNPGTSDNGCVGGIVGILTMGSTVSGCTVSSSTISSIGAKDIAGGIVGLIKSSGPIGARPTHRRSITTPTVSGNYVRSTADKKTTVAGIAAGAVVGTIEGTTDVLSDNYYDYHVEVTQGTTTAKDYTKRGITFVGGMSDAPTFKLTDVETGAMMEVYPVTFLSAASNFASFTPTTAPFAVGNTAWYKKADGSEPFFSPGDDITVTVNVSTRYSEDDGRTLHEDLSSLTMNGGADFLDTKTFTMPYEEAKVQGVYTAANWFTIPSNQKQWMTFYHKWKDATGAPANYTVSDGSGTGKTVKAKTVESFNLITGAVSPVDLSNVSYSGVPTLFHCDPLKDSNTNTLTTLPALLKFTPVADKTAPNYDYRIKGVTTDTTLDGNFIFVMNGLGDFISAYDKSEPLKAHRCYVDLNATPTNATRLYILVDGEETGIETPLLTPPLEGAGSWYDLQGRRLDGKPTKKGLYINGGRKVVIK